MICLTRFAVTPLLDYVSVFHLDASTEPFAVYIIAHHSPNGTTRRLVSGRGAPLPSVIPLSFSPYAMGPFPVSVCMPVPQPRYRFQRPQGSQTSALLSMNTLSDRSQDSGCEHAPPIPPWGIWLSKLGWGTSHRSTQVQNLLPSTSLWVTPETCGVALALWVATDWLTDPLAVTGYGWLTS